MVERKDCPNIQANLQNCTCTYAGCDLRGKCCECIRYHSEKGELPGCLFPVEVEKTYDRTIKKYIETCSK